MTQRAAGFTLVELLVALSLFALVSLLAVALLRSSIDTQAAIDDRLATGGGIERLRALLAGQLMTAQPATGVAVNGTLRPAFTGTPERLAFTSASAADGSAGLRPIALSVRGSELVLARGDAPAVPLIGDIAAARFRYRQDDGSWTDRWSPPRPAMLPRAVELVLTPRGGAPVMMRFVVAPAPSFKPQPLADGQAS